LAGVYIHIPFCYKRCNYCDFHSSTATGIISNMIDSMVIEMDLRQNYLNDREIKTVYFGGGTPSLLSKYELSKLIDALHKNFRIAPTAEITMEMNPDDVKESYIRDIINLDFNRLSLGIQSFDDSVLKYMNRRHNSIASIHSCDIIRNAGISNISIDLIYGIPEKDFDYWKGTMDFALKLKVPHISAYCLSIEEGTRFDGWKKEGKLFEIEDEEMYLQYDYMCKLLQSSEYKHYEVSNFSIEGKHSQHNSAYWSNEEYIGIGPSAHSYNSIGRQWNVASNVKYIDLINKRQAFFEEETLLAGNKYDEYIMTRLRTSKGIDILELEKYMGLQYRQYFEKKINNPNFESYIERFGSIYRLNETGFWFMDGIINHLTYIK